MGTPRREAREPSGGAVTTASLRILPTIAKAVGVSECAESVSKTDEGTGAAIGLDKGDALSESSGVMTVKAVVNVVRADSWRENDAQVTDQ